MKKQFDKAEIELIRFEAMDIVTTSTGEAGGGEGGEEGDGPDV